MCNALIYCNIIITVILIGQFNYFSIVLYTKIRKELLFYNIHFQQSIHMNYIIPTTKTPAFPLNQDPLLFLQLKMTF